MAIITTTKRSMLCQNCYRRNGEDFEEILPITQ